MMIHLKAIYEKGSLRINFKRPKPFTPLETYHPLHPDMDNIKSYCSELYDILSKSAQKGEKSPRLLDELKKKGTRLFDELLPGKIKTAIKNTQADHLLLELDDHLVHIPWELIYLGDRFLCQKFSVGRKIETRQETAFPEERKLSKPYRMWILADAQRDLKSAEQEAADLCDLMDIINRDATIIEADEISENILLEDIKNHIREYDFVHYAGHADYNVQNPGQSSWKLSDGEFTAGDIRKMEGGAALPALVFSNACQSARTNEWEQTDTDQSDDPFGLANAFMLAGVKHYIGTSWEVFDEPSRQFSLSFYKHLTKGKTVGKAVCEARSELMNNDGNLVWASYVLYGDPEHRYFTQIDAENKPSIDTVERPGIDSPISNATTPDQLLDQSIRSTATETSSHSDASVTPNREAIPFFRPWIGVVAVLIIGLVAGWFIFNQDGFHSPDKWTTQSRHMAVMFHPDSFIADADREDIIAAVLEKKIIHDHPAIGIVDRARTKILQEELNLNDSDWIDPRKKLKKGKGLPASLFLCIRTYDANGESVLIMRLVDTVSGEMIDVFNQTFQDDRAIFGQQDEIAHDLMQKLKELYPVRGIVHAVQGDDIVLNIGNDVGAIPGLKLKIVGSNTIIKVISCTQNTSTARIETGDGNPIQKGVRVEALQYPPSYE